MTATAEACDRNCSCGRAGCPGVRTVEITLQKGDVRRAIAAANTVTGMVEASGSPERGVLLMTALVLVERLARSCSCEPDAVLNKMGQCFEMKRRYTTTLDTSN